MTPGKRKIPVNFPQCIEDEFPEFFPVCREVIAQLTEYVRSFDINYLKDIWPGIENFNWVTYLQCSVARMVQALDALSKHGITRGRVLDYGSWFGNFSLSFQKSGFQVDAVDFYKKNAQAFQPFVELLKNEKVSVLNFEELGEDLSGLESGMYDAITCMGVIEHIPHTPRYLLESLNRLLCPGGYLLLDTPNLAYCYNRARFMKNGKSPFPPIEEQYSSHIPFIGHHREYTVPEIKWMLGEIGHRIIDIRTFNYSCYSLDMLEGDDLIFHRIMKDSPLAREYILSVSRKPDENDTDVNPDDFTVPEEDVFESHYFTIKYVSEQLGKKEIQIADLENKNKWLKDTLSTRSVRFILFLNRLWGKIRGKEIENRYDKLF